MRKIKPYGRTYNQRLKEVVCTYYIIYPCKKCGSPVNKGYCCIYCKTDTPEAEEG